MSLQAPIIYCQQEETARMAHASFPKGNAYLWLYDALGPIYTNPQFAALFPKDGQPAAAPAQLALVTIFQFAEGLSDRRAADAVRDRISWKYALCLPLEDGVRQRFVNFWAICLHIVASGAAPTVRRR